MIHAERIDKASAGFFVIAFILAKAQYFPSTILSGIFNLISLASYLIGYILWAIAALIYPESKTKKPSWYGVTEFQQPYLFAAIFGITATFYCFIALIFSVLLIPAVWLYFFSN